MEKLMLNLFNVRNVVSKRAYVIAPICWMVLGLFCWFRKADLSRAAGLVMFFIGLGGLFYNLLKKREA